MTLTEERPAVRESLPGWGIAANLMPPELANARQLKFLQRLMAAGLLALLVICAGGYYLAESENSSASADLVAVADRTTQLQAESRSYSDVVAIQAEVRQIRDRISRLLGGDVDVAALMGELRAALPETMTIDQETITISPAGAAGADSGSATGGLETSGLPRVGTVTITGTGQTLDDLPDYVDRLQRVPGLVEVLPLANTASGGDPPRTQFSISIGLTDELLTHRFDVGG